MELRDLIRRMSRVNPLWGAPRIHGELLKLGLTVSQATISKYMLRQRKPPSQTWRAFLKNHAKDLIAVDFFTVPPATFRILFVLVVLRHARRRLVHFNVTEHPTAGWTARQLVEACALEETPGLVRDQDMFMMPESPNQSCHRPLAQSPEEVRSLHQLCREGRLCDVERWIAEGKPLQLAPEAILKGTRPKTALQIALESGQHSLAFLLLNNGYRLELAVRSPRHGSQLPSFSGDVASTTIRVMRQTEGTTTAETF
jgi:hypothetical protein